MQTDIIKAKEANFENNYISVILKTFGHDFLCVCVCVYLN